LSEIRATTISDAAGTGPIALTKQSAAKAWVYQQSGNVLVESFNISSITDNSIGNYSHNLTSAMVSANGHISMPVCRTSDDRSASVIINSASQFTSYSRDISAAGALEDSYMLAVTHGDLA
jgi:hypothetical protein